MIYVVSKYGVRNFNLEDFLDYFQNQTVNKEIACALDGAKEVYIGKVCFSLLRSYSVAEFFTFMHGTAINDHELCEKISNMTYLTKSSLLNPEMYLEMIDRVHGYNINDISMIEDMLYELNSKNISKEFAAQIRSKIVDIVHNPNVNLKTLCFVSKYCDDELKRIAEIEYNRRQNVITDHLPIHSELHELHSSTNITR